MAVKCDYHSILKWHPEMILVSESPYTLHGFLIVSDSCSALDTQRPRIKLKLIVPNYPSFCDAQLKFDRQLASLRSREFSKEVKELIKIVTKTKQTVSSFLTQLQTLISKNMHDKGGNQMIDFESTRDFIRDLKAALQNSFVSEFGVQLSCDQNLDTIKLSLRDISLTLQRNNRINKIPWKIISSDLPSIPAFEDFEKNIINLNVAITKFKWQVELLENAWEQLKEIDENCWIIDPLEPNKSHMYRRIHLSQSISVTITIDPLNPTALPEINFLGSDNEVKKQMDEVSSNISNWNRNCNILENLRMLLNLYEFPEQQESLENNKAIIGSHDCGICFFKTLDTGELPDKICNNEKCMRHFHSICLSKWLQTNARNQLVFGHIYGTCPHCKENISCVIK